MAGSTGARRRAGGDPADGIDERPHPRFDRVSTCARSAMVG